MSPDRGATANPAPGDAGIAPTFAPDAVRLISDVDTLRAISDPTRMAILETMVQRRASAWSVKELAAALGMPQTRLYHHVELLAQHDLIRPAEKRVVSGIIETRYRVTAESFQLDRAMFHGSEEGQAVFHETLAAVFDHARHQIEVAIRLGVIDTSEAAPDNRRLLLSHGLSRLTAQRAGELRERLEALVHEFGNDHDAAGEPYGIVLAVYPMPTATEPSDD